MVDQGRPLRILCVDDHGDSCFVLKRLLEAQQHSVRTCGTVAEAKAALLADGAERFDLLICDLMLPDGDGRDVMREAARVGVPGVALSAMYVREKDAERSRAAGFLAHLNKPIIYDDLAAVLQQIAATPSPGRDGGATRRRR
jgi:CheY-like chemotaxis protein